MATRKNEPKPKAEPQAEPQVDAATAPQTEDYTRRAGGYVLTDKGWQLEKK